MSHYTRRASSDDSNEDSSVDVAAARLADAVRAAEDAAALLAEHGGSLRNATQQDSTSNVDNTRTHTQTYANDTATIAEADNTTNVDDPIGADAGVADGSTTPAPASDVFVGGVLASLAAAVGEDVLVRQNDAAHYLATAARDLSNAAQWSDQERARRTAALNAHVAQLEALRTSLDTVFTRVRILKQHLITRYPDEYHTVARDASPEPRS